MSLVRFGCYTLLLLYDYPWNDLLRLVVDGVVCYYVIILFHQRITENEVFLIIFISFLGGGETLN